MNIHTAGFFFFWRSNKNTISLLCNLTCRGSLPFGPFNEVHMFDKDGRIKVSSNGHTMAMRDERLLNAVAENNFGAADHGRAGSSPRVIYPYPILTTPVLPLHYARTNCIRVYHRCS
jgi:hypothetical protein